MKSRQHKKVEYRYYEVPQDVPVLALLGEGWVRQYGEEGPNALHFHNQMEIGYCYEGHGNLIIDDISIPYKENTFSIFPRNVCHTTVSDDMMYCRNEYLFIDVEGFVSNMAEEDRRFGEKLIAHVNRKSIARSYDENPALGDAILALIREMRTKKRFYQTSVKGLLLTLLVEIAREDMRDDSTPEPASVIGYKQRLLIRDALTFIDGHYGEVIRIATLADRCHMSETHFRRLFRSIMHITPLEYINIVRVEMACDLLRNTEYGMDIIAQRVGYMSISSFNRNFTKVTALTPMQWKKSPDHYEQKLRNYQIVSMQGWR